jgi:hypothetical protein
VFHPRRFAARVATIAVASIALAAPVLAADTLTPNLVVATLKAGESMTVDKRLDLDGLPARADIIVAVDTTGSMGIPIAQAKADANNICAQVQAAIPGARFAVMDFEDYPPPGPGAVGDIPYLLKTPGFTPSCAAFSAAIATMAATGGSGGDGPEAYNRAYFEAYSDALITSTRESLASQFLVVLGDAEPHSATAFGSCPARPPADFGRDGVAGGGDDLNTSQTIAGLNAANIDLLMIRYTTGGVSVSLSCYKDMANATGGTAVDNSAAPSIGQFIITNAQATRYTVDLQVSPGCPITFSFSPNPPFGPYSGPSTTTFTEKITAPTLPGNYSCTVTAVMNPGGPTKAIETVNLTVTPGEPATLTLSPKTATNDVDTQHCVTATVRDAFMNPIQGVTVNFTVTGSVNTTGSATTDGQGRAKFCYIGPALPGADAITAYADTNNSHRQDPGEPSDAAAKAWVLPASTPLCEIKVNNGGWFIADNRDRVSFGGMAKSDGAGTTSGSEEFQDHGPAQPFNLHGDATVVICRSDTSATIFGTATIDGAGSHIFRIDVIDNGEPGRDDHYRLRVNLYDTGDHTLQGGNVQIHRG